MGCMHDDRGTFGETRFTKAIQGGSTLYILTRAWRTAPYGDKGPPLSADVLAEAREFLGSSVVCADNTPHACPATDAAPR